MEEKMKLFLILNVITLINVVYSANLRIDPLVRIDQGLVRGQLADDGLYAYFLGIPYAKVNPNNPFGKSEPHPGFADEVYDAYDGSIACPQPFLDNSQQTVDCLYLNIHVPYEATSKNPLPVLIWIHGGSFAHDKGSTFNPKYFMDKGIVVVTINYRLGPYGFMCLDTPTVPGNQGLKDQYEALRWVRNNIAAFGGNPYEITIGGQGAGSASAILHLFSSKDKLFKRVIAQSGTPLSDNMFVEADTQAAIKLAEYLGYNTTSTDEALEFLTQTSSDQVISAFSELSLDLKPCKERSFSGVEIFIETYPSYLSNEKKIMNTPILIGHTSREKDIRGYSDDYFESDPFYAKLHKIFDLTELQLSEAAEVVKHFYIGDQTISRELTAELADFESDFTFNHPVQRIVTQLLKENANPVYEYVFSYLGDSNETETSHNADISFIFKPMTNAFYKVPANIDDNGLMNERMTTLWANFVKYGNPAPSVTDLLPVIWDPVTEKTRPYMVINKEMEVKSRIYNNRMAFWDLFFDKYAKNQRFARECTIKHYKNYTETEPV